MSELQQYYEACKANQWVRKDETECGCKGSGWFLSQVDTFHSCPLHNTGQPHPEELYSEEPDWEVEREIERRFKGTDDNEDEQSVNDDMNAGA